jgi:hypothetical protein
MRINLTPSERVLAYAVCDVRTHCWLSTYCTGANGYSQTSVQSRSALVHRLAYGLFVGPIPPGLDLDHLCRNPRCCNPDHLEPVPRRINILRGIGFAAINAAKTHCSQGHPFDLVNTKFRRNGYRKCRVCHRASERRRRERKKRTGH